MRFLAALVLVALPSFSFASDDAFKRIYIQFETAFKTNDADTVSKWLTEDYELLETMSYPGVGVLTGGRSSKKKILSAMHYGTHKEPFPLSNLSGIRIERINEKEFCGYSTVSISYKSYTTSKAQKTGQERKACFRKTGNRYLAYKQSIEIYLTTKSTPSHSIPDDIQALSQFSQEAQQAASRLVGKGTAILPEAHKVLLAKSSNLKLTMQLITVLGQIGDTRSIRPIIKAAKMHPDNPFIFQNALHSFSYMTPTRDTDEFAEAQLENDRPKIMQRMALMYFAMHKDMRAMKWVDKYAINNSKPELKDAALMLGAYLDDQRVKPIIVEMLQNNKNITIKNNLLLALAELVKPDEFVRLAAKYKRIPSAYSSALIHCKFKWGTPKEKFSLVQIMMRSRSPIDIHNAVKYLLSNTNGELLKPYIKYDSNPGMKALIRNEAKQNHYRIIKKGNDVIFQKI